MMSILKNFVNPWESDIVALENEVVKSNVLEHNTLNTPKHKELAYFFDKNGDFVGEFKADKDYIKIIREKNIKKSTIKETYNSKTDTYAFRATLLKDSDILTRKSFHAKNYSKVFTTILKNHKYDLSKIYENKISVRNGNYFYNDVNRQVGFANTLFDEETGIFKISINIWNVFPYFANVSNVISSLGVHEYTAHGINRWTDGNRNHNLAYKLQINHDSWEKTTIKYKVYMIENYFYYMYERNEVSREYFRQEHNKLKKEYGHLKEFKNVWIY